MAGFEKDKQQSYLGDFENMIKSKLRIIIILCAILLAGETIFANVNVTGSFIPFVNPDCSSVGAPSAEEVRFCRGFFQDQNGNILATASPNSFLNYSASIVPPSLVYEYFVGATCYKSPAFVIFNTHHPVFVDETDYDFDFYVAYTCPSE